MLGLKTIGRKVFGTPNDRKIKATRPIVEQINALEPEFEKLSDEGLIEKTAEFKARVANGEALDALLPEAFANCREAAKRALGLRAFDTQLMGGIFLHQGNISEMKTGEGKTLVATFPAYLNALTGRGVHIVTVNDYLAARDAEWMSNVYGALGLSTGIVASDERNPETKRSAYSCDIIYATNNELGFDYLRDNMQTTRDAMMQRDHYFAIVDEVDSILIDEARTPLIISGPSDDKSELYIEIDKLIPLIEDHHFEHDEKTKALSLTDDGNDFMEEQLLSRGLLQEGQTLYDPESSTLVHHVNQGLRAHKTLIKDKDYIVSNNEVVLVDEFTGRMTPGRRLSQGLHQAIEAKEGCPIQPENITLAQVTYQNYFRLYDKLAGMTGTAMTEAEEFAEIYGLGVVEVPTNKPIARQDDDDLIYRTAVEKYKAIVETIAEAHAKGQPTLVGTTSIEKSEYLSGLLTQAGLKHNVLNARQHEKEAEIIADAGKTNAITIATNMAGRGTDIKLGGNVEMEIMSAIAADPEGHPDEIRQRIEEAHMAQEQSVKDAGGLFVLATERHESRRIDNQLRGRSGRQGDPGRSSFFLSLEDDLMRIFGSEKLEKVLSTLGMKEGEAIAHPWVNKSLERAQAKVEAHNFDIRKQLLKFDDVMNDQRKVIFKQRLDVMESDDVSEIIEDMQSEVIDDLVAHHMPKKSYADQWNTEGLYADVMETFALNLPIIEWAAEEGVDDDDIAERIEDAIEEKTTEKTELVGTDRMRGFEKQVLLNTIDTKWREHLLTLDHLKSVIHFRAHAQRDPLNEYKNESFQLFEGMLNGLRQDVAKAVSHNRPMTPAEENAMLQQMQQQMAAQVTNIEPKADTANGFDESDPSTWGNPGRNQACPCGSGKKFKHCHGRV